MGTLGALLVVLETKRCQYMEVAMLLTVWNRGKGGYQYSEINVAISKYKYITGINQTC